MITDYQCEIAIQGPASAVYDALTTETGLRNWWTKFCDVGNRTGETSTFRFEQICLVMRLEKSIPDAEVQWRCLEQIQQQPKSAGFLDEWSGTVMLFQITSPAPSHTVLKFEHHGLNPKLKGYSIYAQSWDHFLKQSLKHYVEMGRGEPFINPPK